jgi:hypothetical protein
MPAAESFDQDRSYSRTTESLIVRCYNSAHDVNDYDLRVAGPAQARPFPRPRRIRQYLRPAQFSLRREKEQAPSGLRRFAPPRIGRRTRTPSGQNSRAAEIRTGQAVARRHSAQEIAVHAFFGSKWAIAAALIIAGAVAPGRLAGQNSKSTQIQEAPFTVSITPEKDTIKSGDPVKINVVVKNNSDHDIRIEIGWIYPEVEAGDHIDVVGPEVGKVQETYYGRRIHGHLTDEELSKNPGASLVDIRAIISNVKPGKTFVYRLNVTAIFDLAKPGKYAIQYTRLDDEGKTYVKSNKIAVTVTS